MTASGTDTGTLTGAGSALPGNPYARGLDADRREIWEMLVARDSDAFAAADWGAVAGDFAADRFEGISANGSADPAAWTLAYPTVDAYRADWLRQAEEHSRRPLAGIGHREVLHRLSALERIELRGDRAIARKTFRADVPLADGTRWKVAAQTIYRLHRLDGRWKIAGFVGYLPLSGG